MEIDLISAAPTLTHMPKTPSDQHNISTSPPPGSQGPASHVPHKPKTPSGHGGEFVSFHGTPPPATTSVHYGLPSFGRIPAWCTLRRKGRRRIRRPRCPLHRLLFHTRCRHSQTSASYQCNQHSMRAMRTPSACPESRSYPSRRLMARTIPWAQHTPDADKVWLASFHMNGVAGDVNAISWPLFKALCHQRFGPALGTNHLANLARLLFRGSVANYAEAFHARMVHAGPLSPTQQVQLFWIPSAPTRAPSPCRPSVAHESGQRLRAPCCGSVRS